MHLANSSPLPSLRNLVITLGLLALAACGGKPDITNTSIQPSAWKISGIADSAQFTASADVLHMTAAVKSVTAQVEGKDLVINLVKVSDVALGEHWSATTNLTLWSGFSSGTYYVNFTAIDTNNTSVTETHAATVVITD